MSATAETWSRVYRRKADIVAREVAGETILVPIRGSLADLQKVFTLNTVGAAVWEQLDGEKSLADIRESLLERYEVGKEDVGADLDDFVASTAGEGLIEEVS